MRSIVHISDPHFGTEDPAVATALLAELDGRARPIPSLVALSGDLTQRARTHQFKAARAFLDKLPGPYLVVPGNHDIPLYDVVSRLWTPLAKYRKHITEDLSPTYFDEELAVAGVDTAHGFTLKDGRITREQISKVCSQLSNHPGSPPRGSGARTRPARWKVLVAHHPFVVPFGVSKKDEVDGASEALPRFEACGLDVILTGHLHVPFISSDAAGFRSDDRKLVSVHAGSAMSTRLRGEPNGYNHLQFDGDELTTIHRVWNGRAFVDGAEKIYLRHAGRTDAFVRVQ